MIKTQLSRIFIIFIITSSSQINATGTPVAHEFQGGQPASASQVNQNFQELANRVAAIPNTTVFDYRDYLFNGNNKTFSLSGDDCADSTRENYMRTTDGVNTNLAKTVEYYTGETVCRKLIEHIVNTPLEQKLLSLDVIALTPDELDLTLQYVPVRIRRTSAMGLGLQSASVIQENAIFTDPNLNSTGDPYIDSYSVVGVEDVIVPAGSYRNCIMLLRVMSAAPSMGHFMTWYCPGVGKVKKLTHSYSVTYSSKKVWQLISVD